MKIPAPQLVKLSADWAPWKFQVNTFGDAIHHGEKKHRVIRTGMSNHETRESAKALQKDLTALHKKFNH